MRWKNTIVKGQRQKSGRHVTLAPCSLNQVMAGVVHHLTGNWRSANSATTRRMPWQTRTPTMNRIKTRKIVRRASSRQTAPVGLWFLPKVRCPSFLKPSAATLPSKHHKEGLGVRTHKFRIRGLFLPTSCKQCNAIHVSKPFGVMYHRSGVETPTRYQLQAARPQYMERLSTTISTLCDSLVALGTGTSTITVIVHAAGYEALYNVQSRTLKLTTPTNGGLRTISLTRKNEKFFEKNESDEKS